MQGYRLSKYIEKVFETPSKDFSEWFGYYNYDTLTSDHSKILCNRIKEDGIAPRADLLIEVGYYDILSGNWHHVGYSDSWNWQQGCMAQWINDEEIIYNSSNDNHHIAIIHNIETKENRKIDWAIYGITPDGKKSISLDMERAHWCRAYHYESVVDEKKNGPVYENDGIFEIDLKNNTRRRIISIQDIISLDRRKYFDYAKHWLEHIMINQAGTKFCVLHRFSPKDNVYLYKTRLIIIDMLTLEMECVSNWENTQWSHFGWDNNRFIIYSYPSTGKISEKDFVSLNITSNNRSAVSHFSILQITKRLIRRIMPIWLDDKLRGTRKHYQIYSRKEHEYYISDRLKNKLFDIDGHPSFVVNRNYIITDTYPDKKNIQRLIVYNTKTHKSLILGSFNAFYKGNPASCDLHPKLSKDGQYVVVDSAHDEKHQMLMFKLNWNRIEQKLG